jgi:hypothetical protein
MCQGSDLFPRVSDLGVAIDGWMAGMYHRRPMLDPQLERIGVGYALLLVSCCWDGPESSRKVNHADEPTPTTML